MFLVKNNIISKWYIDTYTYYQIILQNNNIFEKRFLRRYWNFRISRVRAVFSTEQVVQWHRCSSTRMFEFYSEEPFWHFLPGEITRVDRKISNVQSVPQEREDTYRWARDRNFNIDGQTIGENCLGHSFTKLREMFFGEISYSTITFEFSQLSTTLKRWNIETRET